MVIGENILKQDHSDRSVGVVYRENALSDHPATHVLIVGVAAYQTTKFKKPLDTATISARAISDWFVDGSKARFSNPGCGLGSVAVLLSETLDGAKATYAGGEVPRATFDAVKSAVRAWVMRLNTHKENLAILYVASHGHSFLNRTAFMLEDYGMDPLDVTSGMSEVDQFMGALENAMPVRQLLLFDCCRNPSAVPLRGNEDFGNKLISLTRNPNDHGDPRKQWVICSTSLGEYASGLSNGPTLFNMALLDALKGVAGDATTPGWPVRPGLLVDKIDRILGLHRLPEEKAQTPAGRLAGSFDITYPGEPEAVPVYIALNDPKDWPDCRITVTINGAPSEPINGAEGQSPFHVRRIPELAVIEVKAVRGAADLGHAQLKIRAPASFLEIEKEAVASVTNLGQLSATRPLDPKAKLIIKVSGDVLIGNGAIADILRRDQPGESLRSITVDLGGETAVDLSPGDHSVILRTPDGRVQSRELSIAEQQILQVVFAAPPSPHEWMNSASIAGAIRPSSPGRASADASVEAIGGVAIDLKHRPVAGSRVDIVVSSDDGRFARFDVNDQTPSRYLEENKSAWVPPVFARIMSTSGREELAVIPSLGNQGKYTLGGWTPYLLIDRQAAESEASTTVIVEDRKWVSLLGFLGSRDFAMGTKLLEKGMDRDAIAAMRDKLSNPLAAVAGGLIAVAASSPDLDKVWDRWLRNIAEWFPEIPDGPIILGRRLLIRSRTDEQIAEARRSFESGFERGVPFYSLSVDWLARGLESIPGDDLSLVEKRKAARLLSSRVDPTHTFTVIRIR